METYRLRSRLVGYNREYVIQTSNDADQSAVRSTLLVDGVATESFQSEHPDQLASEEILSLVKARHDEVKMEFEALLRAHADAVEKADPRMMLDLGVALFYKKLYGEARELFETVIGADPERHKAYLFLGQTLIELGETCEAVEAAARAVALKPQFADYRNNLGRALLEDGDVHAAIEEFESAININLYYAEAYINLGLALLGAAIDAGEEDERAKLARRAKDQFERARLINAEYGDVDFGEGMRSLTIDDLPAAYESFRQVGENRNERLRHQYASFYMLSAGNSVEAAEDVVEERIRLLQEELQKNPDYVDMIVQLGHCYLQQSRRSLERAVEQYQLALAKNAGLKTVRVYCDEARKALECLTAMVGRVVERS